jgi:hypothetical protein
MKNQTPCSDYVETSGIAFFARMLDKIRLVPVGFWPIATIWDFQIQPSFDARFCQFWEN